MRPGAVLVVLTTKPIRADGLVGEIKQLRAAGVLRSNDEVLQVLFRILSLLGLPLRPSEFNAFNRPWLPELIEELRSPERIRDELGLTPLLLKPAIHKMLRTVLESSILFEPMRIRVARLVCAPRVRIYPWWDESVFDDELYATYINNLVDLAQKLKDRENPIYDQLSGQMVKVSSKILPMALAGAVAPHFWAAYKVTTARSPEDIDWITKKTLQNPLGATLGGALTFGLGTALLKGKIKLPKIEIKRASEDIFVEPIENITTPEELLDALDKKALEVNQYLIETWTKNQVVE